MSYGMHIGELVGKIVKGNPLREFDGYVNRGDSEKKIVRNVFSAGDMAFLTGTLLPHSYSYSYYELLSYAYASSLATLSEHFHSTVSIMNVPTNTIALRMNGRIFLIFLDGVVISLLVKILRALGPY